MTHSTILALVAVIGAVAVLSRPTTPAPAAAKVPTAIAADAGSAATWGGQFGGISGAAGSLPGTTGYDAARMEAPVAPLPRLA